MESALRATAHGNHVAGSAKLRSRSRGRSHSQAHASAASAAPNNRAAIARAFQSRSRGRHAIRTPCMRSCRSTQPMTQPIRIIATLLNSSRFPAARSHSLSLVPMSQEAISFSIHIPAVIFMQGLRRAKLRSQCYALRPSCDRARNPTACVQSARRRKKRSYFEAASPMQVSCKPCAAQSYATNAPLRERAAIERAFQRHAPDRHVWPCAAERLPISVQGWNRAKLRNQGYASRPRCDRARIAIAPLRLKNPALSNSVCLF